MGLSIHHTCYAARRRRRTISGTRSWCDERVSIEASQSRVQPPSIIVHPFLPCCSMHVSLGGQRHQLGAYHERRRVPAPSAMYDQAARALTKRPRPSQPEIHSRKQEWSSFLRSFEDTATVPSFDDDKPLTEVQRGRWRHMHAPAPVMPLTLSVCTHHWLSSLCAVSHPLQIADDVKVLRFQQHHRRRRLLQYKTVLDRYGLDGLRETALPPVPAARHNGDSSTRAATTHNEAARQGDRGLEQERLSCEICAEEPRRKKEVVIR